MRAKLVTPTYRRLLAPILVFLLLLAVSSPSFAFKMGIHDNITREELTGSGFDEDSADEAADSNYWTDLFEPNTAAAHADDNQLGGASGRLLDKQDLIGDSLAACKRRDALDAFGEALHTVQDVFSHSNSVDNGHAVNLLGMADGTAFCDAASNFAPGGLVTGYFSLSDFLTGNQCRGVPAGSCCHRDLNKDDADVPNGVRHPAAVIAARGATQQYLANVENHIRSTFSPDQAEQMIKMLKRKQRTHYFVIDDTGSMGGDIAGVKAAVNALVDGLVAGGEAPTLGLVSFKDAPVLYGDFCDMDEFRNRVNSLSASGGGDCPEASNSGMLTALNQFPPSNTDVRLKGGRLLLATDASAGDASLGPVVAAEAIQKGVSIDAILTGDCVAETAGMFPALAFAPTSLMSSVLDVAAAGVVLAAASDPLTSPSARTQLRALTSATGGILFQVTRAEVGQVVPTLLQLSSPDSATLLGRRLVLAAGTPVTLDIPVDETFTKSVTFMVALSRAGSLPALTITRPDGRVVSTTDPDVTRLLLSSVDGYTISTPMPGVWRMQLAGNASVIARAYGGSILDVNALRFIDLSPVGVRPEVEFVPIEGQPIVGTSVTADVRLTASPTVAEIRLRREDGTLLQSLVPLNIDNRYFRIGFTVPSEPFLLEVAGTSSGANPFVRQIAVPVTPQMVAISASPKTVTAAPGAVATFQVTVRNASGADATYQLRAHSPLNWSTSVPPAFAVAAGGSATMDVNVQVPANATDGTESDISLLVEDVAAPTTRNSTRVTVHVITNRPPSCTSGAAQPNMLWPPNHNMVPVQIAGVTDPDGDPVTLTVTKITQDEPVDGKGDGHTVPDGTGTGSATPALRAERNGGGDGRVYTISFTANDSRSAQCQGAVNVSVPKNSHDPAVDSGQLYDSTMIPSGFTP
jgi:von Willebrand factor A domain-containing protein 7